MPDPMQTAALTAPQNSAHTPGPWRAITPRKISDAAAGGWGDRAILAGEGPDTVMLAEVFERTVDKRHGTVEGLRLPTDHNAMLITAAPDLLAALQTIVDWADLALRNPQEFDSHGVRNLDGPAFDEARAAIRKATGA